MDQQSRIRFQVLTHRYLDSFISCIGEVETIENSFLGLMGIDRTSIEEIFQHFLKEDNYEIYKKIVIGVDELNDDKVIAYMIGEDLIDVIEDMKHTAEDPIMENYHKIQRAILKPLVAENHSYGNIMIVDSFGVMPKYQSLKIGQILFLEYGKHIEKHGYEMFTGLCYNRITVHMARKFGSTTGVTLSLDELHELCPGRTTEKFRFPVDLPYIYVRNMAESQKQVSSMMSKINAISTL